MSEAETPELIAERDTAIRAFFEMKGGAAGDYVYTKSFVFKDSPDAIGVIVHCFAHRRDSLKTVRVRLKDQKVIPFFPSAD